MAQMILENIDYTYPEMETKALKSITLQVEEGEFILILGASGSGKSSLARLLGGLIPDFYGGIISGKMVSDERTAMLFQDPEKQLIMNRVERELALPLENRGVEEQEMLRRVSEALSFMNLYELKDRALTTLSGGQKQKVALGSTLVGGQRIIILDEPISQLDPVNSDEILEIVNRLNRDHGYTVILVEQRVDKCIHLADRVVYMEGGRIAYDGLKEGFVHKKYEPYLPEMIRLQYNLPGGNFFDIKGGRKYLRTISKHRDLSLSNFDKKISINVPDSTKSAISLKEVSFAYKGQDKLFNRLSLDVRKGESLAVMGANGSGKSTMLKLICGLIEPSKGRINVDGVIGYVSQNPNDHLFHDTLEDELKFTMRHSNIKEENLIDEVLDDLGLSAMKKRNPRDLSGGEKQRAAISTVLVRKPEILILDEPTRGLDLMAKNLVAQTIQSLKSLGTTIIMVTHDIDFAAQVCGKGLLLFDGQIAAEGAMKDVLSGGLYYTTTMNRLFRGFRDDVLTLSEAKQILTLADKKGKEVEGVS